MKENQIIINSYYSKMSFGISAYAIEIIKEDNNLIIKTGTPSRIFSVFYIEDANSELVQEIQNLSQDFLSEKGFEHLYKDYFTHYFKHNKLHAYRT